MADRRNVLIALQVCYMEPDNCGADKCPYFNMRHQNTEKDCGEKLLEDAYILLSERRFAKPVCKVMPKDCSSQIEVVFRCGSCNLDMPPFSKFCPWCGTEVKWE